MKINEFERLSGFLILILMSIFKCREQVLLHNSRKIPREVIASRVKERSVVTRSGNELFYRLMGNPNAERIFVLQHGLGTSSNSLLLISKELLRKTDTQILLVDRAGYRRSRVGTVFPFTCSEAIEDLHDLLVEVFGPKRSIALVGHSLGGYIAYRYCVEHPSRVTKCWLIEPTHPQEVSQIEEKRQGVQILSETLRLNTTLTGLGAAALRTPGDFTDDNPGPVAQLVERESGTGRMMRAMRREWRSIETMLLDGETYLRPCQVPTTVIASDQSEGITKVSLKLFNEFSRDKVRMIPGSDHMSLVLNPSHVSKLCELIG